MRKTLQACFGMALALTALPAQAQQQDFSQVQIKAQKVAGNVHMLEGAGGNIGVSVGSDGILIVDDQFAPLADKIRAALKELGTGKLRFVLNTHWHGDHTGGNASFSKEALIVAHDNVRKRMSTEQTGFGRTTPASPAEALPVVTFGESLSIHFNGEEIRVIHFPAGHTDGDSVIFFTKSNVVHMGDDFFVDRFPFVDLSSGGTVKGLIQNLEKVMAQVPQDIKIIPGHGPLANLADLKRYHGMLVETSGLVQQKIAAGKTLQQVQSEGLPEKWKAWGSGFINEETWLALLYQSLTAKPGDGNKPGSGHGHGHGHGH